jgi:putative exosortase-associated protein (TIGR04073 family)
MKNKSFGLALAILLLLTSLYPQAFAAEGTAGDYFKNMGKQLGVGLFNVVSSPAEIPCTIGSEMSERPNVGFFTGFGKGTVFMLRRIVVGVSEVATFLLPREESSLPVVCTTK